MPTHDYLAELYVAGRLADAGWNVYFPHRDKGFDFIISRGTEQDVPIIRPVQVKGKYPTGEKGNHKSYGYVGKLTQTHPDMVLAIPYFPVDGQSIPVCVAYMPLSEIKSHSRGYRCEPASFEGGVPRPRRDKAKFFDEDGLRLLESTFC